MMFSFEILPIFFTTTPLKRIPKTITKVNKCRIELKDTSPCAMSRFWTVSI